MKTMMNFIKKVLKAYLKWCGDHYVRMTYDCTIYPGPDGQAIVSKR